MLGAAVVKIACKVWLKDNAIAADAAVGVVDIIQSHVSETRERRRLQRLFEDIEEQVADNVLRNMTAEFRGLADNERDAAVLAVADTLDKAKLTNERLFAADLDAAKVVRAVRPSGVRFTRDLSQDAAELYDRVLRDCCAYVVEVANALPGFEVGVFGEILSRQKELVRHLDQRFDRLPMQLGGAGAETFEPTYLRLVANQLDKVELFGVTVSDRVENYPLSVAYVSLSISTTARSEDAGLYELSAEPERRVTSIEDALGGTRRAFIRGEAGSGKTTLLQWLAVRCGRREFDGALRDWNDCVPLLIRLRRYSGADLPGPEEFLRDVGGAIADTMPMGWVHELLRTGRALVLVDGVDELPEKQRRRARNWLRELLDVYPYARYVITSRPAAAAEDWLEVEGFEPLEIQPMTLADLDAFVAHWHAAMVEGVTSAAERERVELSRVELSRTIRTRRHLRMLAVSPLMTALICALHLDRRMQLPDDRMELYSIALEMLLERRDTEREIRSSTVTINRVDKTLILEDLAYWLVRNGLSSAPQERVVERLETQLAGLHRVKGSAVEVLRHLLDRSGLLRMPVDGQIDFVHKTFQEFLAGRAAVAADDIGVLVRNAHDDQWREVVLMAVGHARAGQTDELLRKVLGRAAKEREHRYVLEALAVGCIQHAPKLSPDLQQRMQSVASDLLPPKRIKQAVALAGAGDLALELLSTRTRYSQAEAVATIRMAATIGGDHALPIIAELAARPGREIRDEVTRAWPKFDAELFARDVLSKSPNRDVSLTDPSLLAGLQHLPKTTSLVCEFPHGHGDIEYILALPELTHFSVSDSHLASIAPVADHPALSQLNLNAVFPDLDLSPVLRAAHLDDIELRLTDLKDDGQLRSLCNVRHLGFIDEVELAEVLPEIEGGVPLKRLNLWDSWAVVGLEPLLVCPRTEKLDFLLLEDAHHLRSIEGIEGWADTMTGVFIRASALPDADRIGALPLLEFANLSRTPIGSLDFTTGLPRLRRLHIGGVGLEMPNLEPLCGLAELRDLHIWGDKPVDLSPLADAKDLTVHVGGGPKRAIAGHGNLPQTVKVKRSKEVI
jgi:hypothetical protein